MNQKKIRFIIGCFLLVINQPIGWGGMVLFNSLALKYHNPKYSYIAFSIYGLSWALLGLGIFLAGPQGVEWSKSIFKRFFTFLFKKFSKKSQ